MPAPKPIAPRIAASRTLAAVVLFAAPGGVLADEPAPDAAAVEHFETHIRPLLAKRCVECHGPEIQQGGVRLDRRSTAFSQEELATGLRAIVPGEPGKSRLIEVLAHGELDSGMPPEGPLPAAEIALLTAWVEQGAVWPADRET
ncbi:MAG: c-type cytochrome domain-containing protein, partial [Planctomycetota bacterium]